MNDKTALVRADRAENLILLMRGQKVILDADLAHLYGTTTKRLNEQVRRNINRFPEDFMFQLSEEEFAELKSSFEMKDALGRWDKKRYPPYAFTEHGAIMAAGLINTPLAIEVSIFVVRAFIRLRQMMYSNEELLRKLNDMEEKYDAQFKVVFDAIRELMVPPIPKKNQVGFHWKIEEKPDGQETQAGNGVI